MMLNLNPLRNTDCDQCLVSPMFQCRHAPGIILSRCARASGRTRDAGMQCTTMHSAALSKDSDTQMKSQLPPTHWLGAQWET